MRLTRWLVPVLLMLFAMQARGQAGPVDAVATSATTGLLQQGVLGIFCVLELIAIWILYRQVLATNARFIDFAIRQTEVLAENNNVLRRNEELLEKALDRAALPRAREAPAPPDSVRTDVVGVYRGTRP